MLELKNEHFGKGGSRQILTASVGNCGNDGVKKLKLNLMLPKQWALTMVLKKYETSSSWNPNKTFGILHFLMILKS